MKNKESHITTIILAGGKSSRMGEDKAMLSYNGTPFIDHIIHIASQITDTILLVSDHPEHQAIKNAAVIKDVYANKGPLSGLYSGLSHSKTTRNLVLSCDIPMIKLDVLKFLITNFNKDYQAIIATVNDRIMPLVGIYTKDCISISKELIEKNDLKMMNFIDRLHSVNYIEIPNQMKEQLSNINTPQDVARLPVYIKVCYFGQIAEITGCTEESIGIPKGSIADLKNFLIKKYSGLETASFRIAQNQQLTIDTNIITGEEIALLPPFAGG